MIKITNTEIFGWEHAIRGMRNPKNSWDRSDSEFIPWDISDVDIGENDRKLMMALAKGGPVHAKYRRMIIVYVDVTAPLYWWKEFDTYKVGTVANSCSTMHKIHAKELTLDDFSCERLYTPMAEKAFGEIIEALNNARENFLETDDKNHWYEMIQLLPTSYNQTRTLMLNYEVLVNIYKWRRNHKLDEWHTFCDWIESLPYSEIIIGDDNDGTKSK
jgi:hypothetical protein